MSTTQQQQNPACPACGCKRTVKKGKRRNRLQTLQVFRCTECLHRFTGSPGKNKTYPLRPILEAVSTFNLGYPITDTQRILQRRSTGTSRSARCVAYDGRESLTFNGVPGNVYANPEAKSLAPDMGPCKEYTSGLLRRHTIHVKNVRYIGKEVNRKATHGEDLT